MTAAHTNFSAIGYSMASHPSSVSIAAKSPETSLIASKPKFPILVTGGAGYIGSHAVLTLVDAGWSVVVIDNLSTGFAWAVPAPALLVEGDIADQSLVESLLAEHRIGAIMHFAGSIVVPESVAKPLKYYNNNTAKTRSLLESAVRVGVSTLYFHRRLRCTASLS